MGFSVLDCFPNLLSGKTNERLDAGLKLLQHMHKEAQENGDSKELNHSLNRLIRGLGSSKPCSRKGFYSTFTVYLILNPNTKIEKIFNIMETELKATGSNSKSEVADVNNGRILACGAIIRSKVFKNCSTDDQKKVLECMINSAKKRSYLSFESVSFIVEFLHQFEEESLLAPIWPVLEQEICKPFSEQTLDTFYTLLIIKNKFSGILTKKILKKCFGNEKIIHEKSIEDITRILTDVPRIICTKHPVYINFCQELVETEYVQKFWMGIDQLFLKPSKTAEHLGVELLNILLENLKDKSVIPDLLSPNFLKHMIKRFSADVEHKNDDVGTGFKKALSQLVKVLDKEVKAKLHISVIKKLILYPSEIMIEKITGTKVLQMITNNLNADGVKKLSNLYREIAVNTKFKDKENWTNAERSYAVQLLSYKLMSHPEMTSNHEWRIDQLKFLFQIGLCEASNTGVELVGHFKESFYRALDNKLSKLDDLRTILSSLITYINESVFQNSELKLRTPFDEASTEAWKKMMKLVKKIEKESNNNEKVGAVFHTMNLHMGLQLFSDSEMAISSINELHSCFEHFKAQNKSSEKKNIKAGETEELEWVEVVVDLLLSFLSRNSHLLRSLVGCVFPHICPHLTSGAIHQILSILDVRSGKNPLSTFKDADESDSELESEEEEENEEEEEEEEEEDDNNEDEMNGEIEEESDSDVEESEVDEEDDTVTDRIRLAVSQALGDAPMLTDDEDVDVDNINEEDGKRLDESLAAAFRILKENRKAQTKKQEKKAQALTHFRIRVIDLLEIYLETGPSMTLALEMLIPLFALLEFSIKDPHQQPLQSRVRSCLKKLANVKKFKSVEDVDEDTLIKFLKALIEKGERSASVCQEMGDKLAECCVFIVRCSQQTNIPGNNFINVFGENLTAFFKKRDCILPAVLFKNLLQLCWVGNWHLAPLIVHFAFDDSIRSFRRGQALEFLTVFYNNVRMITSDNNENKRLEMEKQLCNLSINVLQELNDSQPSTNGQVGTNVGKGIKQKYICHLFQLLFKIHPHHIPEAWNWKKLGESMANYRSNVSLANDAKHAYNKLAMRIKVPVVPKKQKNEKSKILNGHDKVDPEPETETESEAVEKMTDPEENCSLETSDKVSKKKDKKKKKKNSHTMEKHKLKKEARELRAKAMSEGLDSFDFSSVNLSNGISDNDELLKNGTATDENTTKAGKVKRKHQSKISEVPSKKKKKVVESGD